MNEFQAKMLIDGELVGAASGKTFASVNPAKGEVWTQIPEAGGEDAARAVEAAHRQFKQGEWARATPFQRGQYLRKLGEVIARNGSWLAEIETTDTGKLLKETMRQSAFVARNLEYYAGLVDKVQGDTHPTEIPNTLTFTLREPLGVVAGIIPWNSQIQLTMAKVGPALAAGNTVVLKASEQASAPLLALGQLIVEAGFPPGVVNILSGYGEPVGRVLTTHRLVRRIAFTGGVETARQIVRNSAENLAPLSLELGGKSPVLLFDDADLDNALNGVVGGIFAAGGQSCVAGSRLYLQDTIADAFLNKLKERVSRIVIGEPMDPKSQMGPLATKRQLDVIEQSLAEAKRQGLRVVAGGGRPEGMEKGWYFQPTIIESMRNDAAIVDRELFGPVLTVIRFSTEEQAVEMANASQYGFACGIYTRDLGRAMRLSKAIDCGVVWVNSYRMLTAWTEYGGRRNTGYGSENGLQSIYDYTQPKLVWLNIEANPLPDPLQ
jgi:acyl-CoA reductase-like NAD-dependent aldehyde dehydrogenase